MIHETDVELIEAVHDPALHKPLVELAELVSFYSGRIKLWYTIDRLVQNWPIFYCTPMVGLSIVSCTVKDLAWSIAATVVSLTGAVLIFSWAKWGTLPGPKRRAKYREKLDRCAEISHQLIDGKLSLEEFEAVIGTLKP
jgi:hypothetical protein